MVKENEKMYRALIRTVKVHDTVPQILDVVIPGWDSKQIIHIKTSDMPEEVRVHACHENARFFAKVNMGAETVDDLYIESYEVPRMRRVEDMWKALLQKMIETDDSKKAYEWLKTEYKEKYEADEENKYHSFAETHNKMFRELENYGKVAVAGDSICITGDDACLKYTHQCQNCGTVIVIDHGEEECIAWDLVCPVCNGLEEKRFPFEYIKYGTEEWTNHMIYAKISEQANEEMEKEGKGSYSVGVYKRCKFKPTRKHLFIHWFYMRGYHFMRKTEHLRHPKKYIKDFYKHEEWRSQMGLEPRKLPFPLNFFAKK